MSLFLSHGAPSLVLEPSPTSEFLRALSAELPRPEAIVCVTAHWETARPAVALAAHPAMIYDFSGFPRELYQVRYPAPGHPQLAARMVEMLGGAGDPGRGFDHGVWSPLMLMYPKADIPVVSVAVQPGLDAAHHFAMGRALRPLAAEGVLIVGSGSTTHNLGELGRRTSHAAEFESWVCEAVEQGRVQDLIEWEGRAPHARRNHPTPEHFLPLFVALGAALNPAGRVRNRLFEYGSLSMAAFQWE